ncbi:OCIA domain-containing protein 1 [Macrosteles quadrilineatus]|uniref:OCIA domain-containing protein 1 n=1 Tax=Macrosteles quadrilineatus TaxID=74068 RepID=UPI0023E1A538|nr:OCIA domain-containing protein 1 [Macrosteles quadrilineatus]
MAGNTTTIPADPLHSPQATAPTPLVLTPEDKKIIGECNRDAFFQRCIPFATTLGGLTYMAVKAGYMRGSVSWGPTPKVIVAVFAGYFAGKISYQQTCAERLMASPTSQLGAMLRARRQQGRGGFQDTLTLDMPGYPMPALTEDKPRDAYQDDLSTRTFTDLDTDRPYTQSEDAYRYSFDSNPQSPEDFVLPPQSAQSNSYDELRRRNREEFEKKQKTLYSSRPLDDIPRPSPIAELHDPFRPTNAYGDVFDK